MTGNELFSLIIDGFGLVFSLHFYPIILNSTCSCVAVCVLDYTTTCIVCLSVYFSR